MTLILDDTGGDNVERIWNIYYHVIVDDASLNTLRKQASKLLKEAATATEWNKTRYGAILRFCDSYTFSQVLKLWKFYALQPSHGQSFKKQQEKLRNSTKKANEIQRDIVGDKLVYTGIRSAAPQMNSAVKDVANSYKIFWRTGSSRLNQARTRANRNPMFGTTDSRHILHYGTDPVIGYHLSTAYAELSEDSPLKTDASKAKKMGTCFSMAFEQFRAFTKALRKSASYLTLRFVITDAMALCHTFQHMQIHESSNSAGWYRSFRTWQPLVLDNRDYFAEGTNTVAPLSFDVIDTSNLMDHLGCLNLLTAAGPLLKQIPTSTLSTEVLVPREVNVDQFKKNLLFGDIPTVSLLLSLNPVENWTGATSRADSPTRQPWFILHWKSTAIYDKETANPSLSFESKELAGLLFQVYKGMFSNENPTGWLSSNQDRLQRQAYAHYTRSSFVAILSLIRRRNMVVWDDFMHELYRLIMNDASIKVGASYAAEMTAYLDILGLRPMPDEELPSRLAVSSPQCPLQHWKHVPSSLCVTMIVPREKLRLFKRTSSKGGNPIVQMVLRDFEMDVQSFYLSVQAGFGHLRMLGERYSEDLALEIEEDKQNWDGTAPMIVSAVVPSSVVLQKVDLSTEVIFALNQSLYSFAAFGNKLGLELAISKSTLASEDVYITKNRPNMSTHLSFSGINTSPSVENVKQSSTTSSESDKEETQTQFHARLTTDQSKLESIMAHIDILPGQLQNVLQSGAGVKATQSSLFEVSISFDTGTLIKRVQFPTPISMNGSKTLVAQKPSYVEFIAPVPAQKEIFDRPDSLYPMVHGRTFVGFRTPHYVSLDRLPILSRTNAAGMSWLLPHLSGMFSLSGHDTQETQVKSGSKGGDVRVNFKDSLLALFSCSTGMNGVRRPDVLALNSPEEGGVHMLIFVSSLRLDMSCQHVVLDVAVLPLSLDTIPKMVPLLNTVKQRGFLSITVDKSELLQWKHALPAMVERCRDWNHKPSCEYLTSGKVPVSVEFGQQPLCSCGKGRFPRSYKTALPGIWKEMSKHAVRAAIAPIFPYPSLSTSSSPTNQMNRVRGKSQSLLMALLKRLRR